MASRKNLLFITIDQWRGDFVPWGERGGFLSLPNLEALASQSCVFDRHYSVATPCGPSRASLMTGLYVMNHRAVQNTVPLDARHETLPRHLRRLGYEPAMAGYTTTTPDPRSAPRNDPRFRTLGEAMEGFRVLATLDPYPMMHEYFRWLAQHGYALPAEHHDVWLPDDDVPGPSARPSRLPAHLSDSAWVTDVALAYLADHEREPWALHLCYWRPHPPFTNPAPYHESYRAVDMPPPLRAADPAAEARQHPLLATALDQVSAASYFRRRQGLVRDLTAAEVAQARATYCGMLREVDDQLGRVLAHLRASGQLDDTLIVLTSDHGELLGDHHLFGKASYFDPVFHVPLIVRLPGAAPRRVAAFTESVDLLPSILEWLGEPAPRACDGLSLLPWCRGETPADWRREAHFEFDFRDVYYSAMQSALGLPMDAACLAGIVDEAHKYVHFAALPPLLFDRRDDPGELVDRAGDPTKAAALRDLLGRLLTWRLLHAERTLTGFRATPGGLEQRGG
jgi:arylsulfatase A-like enzyme